jgi:hypothetical protein
MQASDMVGRVPSNFKKKKQRDEIKSLHLFDTTFIVDLIK